MKKKIIAAAILMAGIASNAHSQTTAYASTTAELVTPIAISRTTNMHFGKIASSGTPGTVVLDYVNGRTTTGGVTLPAGTALETTAVFAVTGESNSSFSIAIPSAPITLTGSVAGSMTVSNFECDGGTTTTLVSGAKTLKVKATLNVPANSAAGVYTNDLGNASALFVTVNYN